MTAPRKPFNARCGACGHVWTAAYLPMGLERMAKLLKGLCCVACGEPSRNIFLDNEAMPSDSGLTIEISAEAKS